MRKPVTWRLRAAIAIVSLTASALAGCDQKVAGGSADGRAVFDQACARCHGAGGVPEPARAARIGVKDLTSKELQQALGDDEIRERIMSGSANRRMPAFGSKLSSEQVDALVRYIRTLGSN